MNEGQGLSDYLKGLSLKLLCSNLETIHSKITKLQPIIARTSKSLTFDLESQCHLWMKVKVSVIY
jgi:hypothetical protein